MAITSGYGTWVRHVAAKEVKKYTVTFSSSENAYEEQQLFRSIFESLYAISQDNSTFSSVTAPEEPRKE